MKYKFFKIPVSAPEPAEAQRNAFLSSHQVIQVDKLFVDKGEFSFWAFVHADSRQWRKLQLKKFGAPVW